MACHDRTSCSSPRFVLWLALLASLAACSLGTDAFKNSSSLIPLPGIADDETANGSKKEPEPCIGSTLLASDGLQDPAIPALQTEIDCQRTHMNVHLKFSRPFAGYIYPYGFFSKCILWIGRCETEVKLKLHQDICGAAPSITRRLPDSSQSTEPLIEHRLMVQWDTDLVQEHDTTIILRCDRPGDYNRTIKFNLSSVVGERHQALIKTHPGPTMRMAITDSDSPTAPPVVGPVYLGQTLTLVFTLDDEIFSFDSNVLRCWANDGTTSHSLVPVFDPNPGNTPQQPWTPQLQVIKDGCSIKPKLFGNLWKVRNGPYSLRTTMHWVFFKAFRFPTTNRVVIQCDLQICFDKCSPQKPCGASARQSRSLRKRQLGTRGEKGNTTTLSEFITMYRAIDVLLPEASDAGSKIYSKQGEGTLKVPIDMMDSNKESTAIPFLGSFEPNPTSPSYSSPSEEENYLSEATSIQHPNTNEPISPSFIEPTIEALIFSETNETILPTSPLDIGLDFNATFIYEDKQEDRRTTEGSGVEEEEEKEDNREETTTEYPSDVTYNPSAPYYQSTPASMEESFIGATENQLGLGSVNGTSEPTETLSMIRVLEVLIPEKMESVGAIPAIETDIDCQKTHMDLLIKFPRPFYGYIYPDGRFAQCILWIGNGETEVRLRLSQDPCGAPPTTTYTPWYGYSYSMDPLIEHRLMVQWNQDLVQEYDTAVHLRCDRPDDYNRTITFNMSSVIGENLQIHSKTHPGPRLLMDVRNGHGPTAPNLPGRAFLGQNLSLVFTLKDEHFNFDSNVLRCWATDGQGFQPEIPNMEQNEGRTPLRPSFSQLQVIDSACSTQPNLFGDFQKIRDPYGGLKTTTLWTQFKAFRFPTTNRLLIQCDIQVCFDSCLPSQPCKYSNRFQPESRTIFRQRRRVSPRSDKSNPTNAIQPETLTMYLSIEIAPPLKVTSPNNFKGPLTAISGSTNTVYGIILGLGVVLVTGVGVFMVLSCFQR